MAELLLDDVEVEVAVLFDVDVASVADVPVL
ncbi:hypothetical protein MCP1_20193 [Candidatus Terasakiella magnetica]|nr:hypothetical protein MCP1_20193 [Candidatus Terasakiella magnetica]